MTFKLFIQAIFKMFLGIILLGILIFFPAGTLYFKNGWLLIAFLFVPMFFAGIFMMIYNPSLLKNRLDAKEEQKEQKEVVILSGIMFIFGFIIAGFDFRFGFSNLPKAIIFTALILFCFAYIMYAEVIRENTYLSRTIKVQENQKVIDTGLYRIVRHPMYTATIFLFLAMPLILGSFFAFLIFLAYPFIIAKRIKYEEEFLKKELCGYKEYTQKVKYRLIPFIW